MGLLSCHSPLAAWGHSLDRGDWRWGAKEKAAAGVLAVWRQAEKWADVEGRRHGGGGDVRGRGSP